MSSSGMSYIVSGNTVVFEMQTSEEWEAETLRTCFLDNSPGNIVDLDGTPVPSFDAVEYTQTPESPRIPESIEWDTNTLQATLTFSREVLIGEVSNLLDFQVMPSDGNQYNGTGITQVSDFVIRIGCTLTGTGDSSETASMIPTLQLAKQIGGFALPTFANFTITET